MGIIVLFLSAAAIVFLTGRVRIKKSELALEGAGNTFLESSDNNFMPERNFIMERKKGAGTLFVEFPLIKENFPNVWGVGDAFLVRFIDDKGSFCEKQLTFHKKGKYAINVSGENAFLASRQLNIVIYREESISLGKEFLKDMPDKDIKISDTMTLREIYLSLESKVSEKKYRILEKIFVILEKAVYSLDVIDRNDYEIFLTVIKGYKIS